MIKMRSVAMRDVFMKLPTIKLCAGLVTLLLFPLFVYLGFWQLDRANEKKLSETNATTRKSQETIFLKDLMPSPEAMAAIRYRTLQVTGTFLNEQTLLLDNQILKTNKHTAVGYQVITPFQPAGSHQLILVNRGWIPLGKNRETLPIIPPIHHPITLSGTINQPSNGLSLALPQKSIVPEYPKRIQVIDYTKLATELKQDIYPFLLTLKPGDPSGFQMMPLFFKLSVERHIAYAVQWFMMSLAVLIYYGVVHCRGVR
jgi:surfeit locus 1 family protein